MEFTYPPLVCNTVLPLFNCIFTKICCFLNSVYLLRSDKNSNIIVLNYIVGGSIVGGSIVGGSIVGGSIVGGSIVGGSIVAHPAGDVLRHALAVAPPDVKAILPAGYLLKKQVRRNQKVLQAAPSSPTSAAEDYQKDSAGNLFLQYDTSTPDGHRILVFSTDLILDAVNTSTIDTIFADGTFKSSPPFVTQVWVLQPSHPLRPSGGQTVCFLHLCPGVPTQQMPSPQPCDHHL